MNFGIFKEPERLEQLEKALEPIDITESRIFKIPVNPKQLKNDSTPIEIMFSWNINDPVSFEHSLNAKSPISKSDIESFNSLLKFEQFMKEFDSIFFTESGISKDPIKLKHPKNVFSLITVIDVEIVKLPSNPGENNNCLIFR